MNEEKLRLRSPAGGKNWWRRKGSASCGFFYQNSEGKKIKKKSDVARIEELVIPPAWKFVRINPAAGGRIQAVGSDIGCKIQYIYHSSHTKRQKNRKFGKLEQFAKHLPALRRKLKRDLAEQGLSRTRVTAAAVRVMERLNFRVGSQLSEDRYKTFGITTLKRKHLRIGRNGKIEFDFVGKSHVRNQNEVTDKQLAKVLSELSTSGRSSSIFRYIDEDGKKRTLRPKHVNEYIKSVTENGFSSKDLRTCGGTLLAAIELADIGVGENERETKKNVVTAVKAVAGELGNTPAVCRESYIHPKVIASYEKGLTLLDFLPRKLRDRKVKTLSLAAKEKALTKLLRS